MTDFDYDRIAAAREALAGRVIRTPALPLCGSKIAPYIPDNAELFIKLELFQHTGSFKARGSCLGIDWLDAAQRHLGAARGRGRPPRAARHPVHRRQCSRPRHRRRQRDAMGA